MSTHITTSTTENVKTVNYREHDEEVTCLKCDAVCMLSSTDILVSGEWADAWECRACGAGNQAPENEDNDEAAWERSHDEWFN